MALNKVIEQGRLVANPELRTTANDISVTSFSIAVDKPYNKNNNHPESNFFDCVAWRGTAEFICKYFKKGDKIIIEGSLQSRKFVDKNETNRKVTEIVVENAHFVEKRNDNPSDSSSQQDEVQDSDDLPM